MGNPVARGAAAQRKTLPESGDVPGSEGFSLLGIRPARILNIPLKRWGLSLLLLVLCALGAYGFASWRAESSYDTVGRLLHKPPADKSPELPDPPPLDTIVALFKNNNEYYVQLNEKFGLGIYPEVWQRIFAITKTGADESRVIEVRLKWNDPKQGAQLVNYLMDLHRQAMAADRERALRKVLDGTDKAIQDCDQRTKAAMSKRDQFLQDRKAGGNPKETLNEINATVRRLENQLDVAETENIRLATEVRKKDEEIAELRKKRPDAAPKQDDLNFDEDFVRRKRDLEKALIDARLALDRDEADLDGKRAEYKLKKPLADKGLIIGPVIDQIAQDVKKAQRSVDADKKRLVILQAEMKELQPGNAQLRLRVTQRSELLLKQVSSTAETDRVQRQLEVQRKRYDEMAIVEKDWRPLDQAVTLLDKEREVLLAQKAKVGLLIRNVASELEVVGSGATPSPITMTDFKKQFAVGFLYFAVPCFGLLIASGMASKVSRAQVLSDRLRLPILAQATNETRALSLRIRQFVPQNGGAVLISSLNEGNGVDQLVIDLARYSAMRDERVLILDARIAGTQAAALRSLIERRVDGQPPEVVPPAPAAAAEAAEPGMPGLVQYLVFEGQTHTTFTYHTHLPGVDYMPAGGPYPVTDALASEPMDELLQTLRKQYTLLLVVGPAVARGVDTEILAAYVDGMVFVLNSPLGVFSQAVEVFVRSLREKNAPLLGSALCV